MMIEDIEGRSIRYSSYGLVFTKTTARRRGCNPVWYLDITPGHHWLTNPVNVLVQEAKAAANIGRHRYDAEVLAPHPVLQLTPFIEQMGPTGSARKEFWWEREWRHAGDFGLHPMHVVAIFAPADDHDALRDEIEQIDKRWERRRVPLLEPIWGQERMIGAMSGIDEDQLGPFPED